MLPHQRDNGERLARIDVVEELRRATAELRELVTEARERAAARCREAHTLVQEVREARTERAAQKR